MKIDKFTEIPMVEIQITLPKKKDTIKPSNSMNLCL